MAFLSPSSFTFVTLVLYLWTPSTLYCSDGSDSLTSPSLLSGRLCRDIQSVLAGQLRTDNISSLAVGSTPALPRWPARHGTLSIISEAKTGNVLYVLLRFGYTVFACSYKPIALTTLICFIWVILLSCVLFLRWDVSSLSERGWLPRRHVRSISDLYKHRVLPFHLSGD